MPKDYAHLLAQLEEIAERTRLQWLIPPQAPITLPLEQLMGDEDFPDVVTTPEPQEPQ